VLLNLLNNALDAITEEGQVLVRTRCEGDFVVIEVEDTGSGIPEAFRDQVFDPFFTTKEPGKGNGLGLSISHTIVQQLGGTLGFTSEPGRGTTFLVTVPRNIV
jgi:two-component system NtrC family sensor kinase